MKKGLIKVSVLYPNGEGKNFDKDYYYNKHMPLVSGLLGDAVRETTVESGLTGAAPGSQAPFVTMCNFYFESIEAFNNAFGPNAAQIMGDIPNYTNIEPVIQISEVMV